MPRTPRTPKFKRLEFNDRWFDLIADVAPERMPQCIAAIVDFVRTGTLPADESLAEEMFTVFEQIDAEQRHRAEQKARRSERMKRRWAERRQQAAEPAEPQPEAETPSEPASHTHTLTPAERRAIALEELPRIHAEAYARFEMLYPRFVDSGRLTTPDAWDLLKKCWPDAWPYVSEIYEYQSHPDVFSAYLTGELPPRLCRYTQ